MTVKPPANRLTIISVAHNDGKVDIDWADGHRSVFHNVWLRYDCACDICGTTISAIRRLCLTDIPLDITPAHINVNAEGLLEIAWPPDNHSTVYNAAWLRAHCYSAAECSRRRFRPELWGPEIDGNLPTSHYNNLHAFEDSPSHYR